MRLSAVAGGDSGFDADLYLEATRAWLAGADPWIYIETQRFAAPPPTLVPLAPIAILPEDRRHRCSWSSFDRDRRRRHDPTASLPWWWLLFPPFLDAAWNGNPQTLLVPLILVGAGPIAAFLKIYALVPLVADPALAGARRHRRRCSSSRRRSCRGARTSRNSATCRPRSTTQSDGGLSATAMPWLIPIAVVALFFCRSRARRLAGSPRPLAGHAVVLLDARAPCPDPDRRGAHRGPDRRDARSSPRSPWPSIRAEHHARRDSSPTGARLAPSDGMVSHLSGGRPVPLGILGRP